MCGQHAITVEGEHGATFAQLHTAVNKAKGVLWTMHGEGGDAPPFRLISLREHEAIDLSDDTALDRAKTLKQERINSGDAVVIEWGISDKSSIVAAYNTQQNCVAIKFNHPNDIDPKTRSKPPVKV